MESISPADFRTQSFIEMRCTYALNMFFLYFIFNRTKNLKKIEIFTDGACQGNPGPGGWGAILRYNGHEKEISGGEGCTTNNRMELCAVIEALSLLKEPCNVTLFSDSKYVCDAISKGWAKKWQMFYK